MPPERAASDEQTRFTTIKIRMDLRQWIKMLAVSRGMPMYQTLEDLIADSEDGYGRPWREEELETR